MMGDSVRSKPWLGLLGNISAVMATAAAFGLAMYLRVDFIGINLAAPFLMIGKCLKFTLQSFNWRCFESEKNANYSCIYRKLLQLTVASCECCFSRARIFFSLRYAKITCMHFAFFMPQFIVRFVHVLLHKALLFEDDFNTCLRC
jgi:Patched family